MLAACAIAALGVYSLDGSVLGKKFDGIGGLSAGASSRALIDYPEPQRSDILDLLFKPQYGAAFQILKVEIGGDSQSTDGTEASHMHSKDSVNFHSGYEWWLIEEAKSRNPDIKIYGLPWAFPSWVATNVTDPTSPYVDPRATADYVSTWVHGVESVYNHQVDYLGIWNERASSAEYVHQLRLSLNEKGFGNTKIVAADQGTQICDDLSKNSSYAADVDIIGLHYPSDYKNYSLCHSLGKPVWSSEESSSFDDYNGAACWARVITSHYVRSNMTSSIIWAIIGSMYHGTGWFGAGALTAVEPWSGFYTNLEVLWATAHITQFTKIGWHYLSQGSGSGQLDKGGYYTTFTDSNGTFSVVIVKISHEHSQCVRPGLPVEPVEEEVAQFKASNIFKGVQPTKLTLFKSNFVEGSKVTFEKQPDIEISSDGMFTVKINVGDILSISNIETAKKGAPANPPPSTMFPLPYSDDFSSYPESSQPKFISTQIGSFEIVKGKLQQKVPSRPIAWARLNGKGPVTLIGMSEWEDVSIGVEFILSRSNTSGCVANRADQNWDKAVALCASSTGEVSLYNQGPNINGAQPTPIFSVKVAPIPLGQVTTLNLTTIGGLATGYLQGKELFKNVTIEEGYFGLSAFGTDEWAPTEFLGVSLKAVGDRWNTIKHCQAAAKVGDEISVKRCQPNSVINEEQAFTLSSTWQLVHTQSGLCVTVDGSITNGTKLVLQECVHAGYNAIPTQYFYNDYSNIRNGGRNLNVNGTSWCVVAEPGGSVYVSNKIPSPPNSWSLWSYFPNTNQLRNQYSHSPGGGEPLCLSRC
eukprot:TRINITY_DN15885_c0_g1_i1.p1 TRINITY_DN15885_c0_g1~~TRINITY_DN15885_c0_g1_i1.p1  ORF type:complete len:809 (+),score=115.84 TRINITY_DN15885_c0_g1_i1:109-2535(+)